MTIWTGAFWRGAAERGLKTFVQTFVAVAIASTGAEAIGVSAGILDLDWLNVLSVSLLATLLSVGTSLGNSDFVAGTPAVEDAPADTLEPGDVDDADLADLEEDYTEVTYDPVEGDDPDAYVDGDKVTEEQGA